jgi:dihydrofolate reductase
MHFLTWASYRDPWVAASWPVTSSKLTWLDEFHVDVVPVLVGEGIPLFPGGFPQRDFSLIENKSYSKGLMALKYERHVQE